MALRKLKHDLPPNRERFVREYIKDRNASKAAERAGYSAKSAGAQGHFLLKIVEVQQCIEDLEAQMLNKLDVDAETILAMWWDTASADPNELSQHRIGSCRYCWGYEGNYQWKSPREFNEALLQHKRDRIKTKEGEEDINSPTPTEDGGFGYRITNDPNPHCMECSGLGVSYTVFADTTKLSKKGLSLYEGVEVTSTGGLKLHSADRAKARDNLAKRFGLMKETIEHEAKGGLADFIQQLSAKGSAAPIIAPGQPMPDADDGEDG
jgi:phage terminase small subunit